MEMWLVYERVNGDYSDRKVVGRLVFTEMEIQSEKAILNKMKESGYKVADDFEVYGTYHEMYVCNLEDENIYDLEFEKYV